MLAVIFSINHLMSWESGQGIGLGIRLSGTVCEIKMEAREVGGPSGLPSAKVLGCAPILEVRVVGDNFKWVGEAFQKVSPVF